MIDRVCLGLLALVLSGVCLRAVAGHDRFAGRVLISFTANHGLDAGDVPVIVAWLVGMACLAVLWTRRSR